MNDGTWIDRGLLVAGSLLLSACDAEIEAYGDEWAERSLVEPDEPDKVLGMGLGDGESWVVGTNGELEGWGRRYCDSVECLAPLDIASLELPGPAVAVSSNGSLTAALMADGTIQGWGPAPTDAPELVPAPGAAVELALGHDFMCVRLDDDRVECQGLEGHAEPSWLAGFEPPEGAVELTAGAEHACARLDTGQLACWGNDDEGQLGAPTSAGTASPPLWSAAEQIAAGGAHTCARLDTGEVQCWGRATEGQLGHAGPGVGPVPLPEAATWIAAGAEHSCAIGATGSLYCWWSNAHGQLAQGQDSAEGIRHVDLGGALASRVMAGATSRTTFVVLDTGGLRGWGRDHLGQTGYGDLFRDDTEVTRNAGDLPDIPIFVPKK